MGVGMALSAAGAMVNAKEQQSNQNRMVAARQDAAQAERIRQKAFQEENAPIFTGQLEAQSRPQQDQALANAQTARQADAQTAVADASSYGIVAPSAPGAISSNLSRVVQNAVDKARKQTAAGGNLAAWGDVGLNTKMGMSDAANKISMINDFSRGSANLLPFEQAVAERNAYKPPSGIGDLLSLGGTAVSMGGGMGMFGGAAGGVNGPAMDAVRAGTLVPGHKPPLPLIRF